MTHASAEAGREPRTFLVRGFGACLGLFAMLLCVFGAAPAVATPTVAAAELACNPDGTAAAGESATNPRPYDDDTLNIKIEEAQLPFKNNPNNITMAIVITNKNKKPTCASYPVFLTFNEVGAEPEETPACADVSFNDPDTPRGVYHCTAIIEGPGDWTFTATVNRPADVGQVQTQIRTVETTINFDATQVAQLSGGSKAIKYAIEGRTFEVFLLQLHVAMAGLWLLLAAVLAFLAVPRLRRTLSVLAVHSLEVRRGFLNSSLWATFGLTLGTGMYLLATQTAYPAPFATNNFSFSDYGKVTNLPYAQSYFLALYGKIVMFGIMAAASVILMLEAGRRAQMAQDAEGLDRDDDDDMWSKGVHFDEDGHVLHDEDVAVAGGATASVTGTAVKAQRRTNTAVGVSQRTLWACVLILAVGTLAIGGAVTGLKYLHELTEMASAAAILRSSGG